MLADLLREKYILSDLKGTGKVEVLEEMVDALCSRAARVERASLLSALLEREKLGSTGIGHGVAVPHGRVKGLDEIILFFARSRKGVDFDSMDKMPVHLFFVIIVPEHAVAAHLKILASISHLLKNQEFRAKLMRSGKESEIYRIIADADRHLSAI